MLNASMLLAALSIAGAPESPATRPAPTPETPLRVHMISGAKEYAATACLERLARRLEATGCVRVTHSKASDRAETLDGLDALEDADVLVVYARRLMIDGEQLGRIKAWCDANRPVVGFRTASHAFQKYLAFDKEVLGGDYRGHGPGVRSLPVEISADDANHPVLAGVRPWRRPGKLYRNPRPAKDIRVLMHAEGPETGVQPVAWVRTREGGGRVFYTSLGLPEDFARREFLHMATNAVFWCARTNAPRPTATAPAAAGR